jgi:hypothetical protein
MFTNAEQGAPETFRDTKLMPLRQHHCTSVIKYHIGHFTVGIIFRVIKLFAMLYVAFDNSLILLSGLQINIYLE